MKRVLIADDHPMFRQGMKQTIEETGQYKVIAEIGDGSVCILQAELLRPDIAVVDISMPGMNGFDVVDQISRTLPDTKSIMVSMHTDEGFVRKAIDVGAAAFVAKDDTGGELLSALNCSIGSFFMSSSVGRSKAIPSAALSAEEENVSLLIKSLTHSEIKVLRLVSRSKTSREIATELGLSHRTVQTHRQNISAKLDLRGVNSLLNFAVRNQKEIEERCND